MLKKSRYDKTYTTQTGKNLGESPSNVWTYVGSKSRANLPGKGKQKKLINTQRSENKDYDVEQFPSWSVWFPGDSFPEHPGNTKSKAVITSARKKD